MKACRIFHFDAAHFLPDYNGTCERLHGHTYRLEVEVEKDVGDDGMVVDFNEIKRAVNGEILPKLDHASLNEVIEKPTAENIVAWIWDQLKDKLPLSRIRLYEGDRKWVEMQHSAGLQPVDGKAATTGLQSAVGNEKP